MANRAIAQEHEQQKRARQQRERQRCRRRQRSRRRQLGAYYTPQPIVRAMLRLCLDGPLAERLRSTAEPVRILDPACGDGAFLLSALQEVRSRSCATGRSHPFNSDDHLRAEVEIVAAQLFGADVDPQAIHQLRRKMSAALGPGAADSPFVKEQLTSHFCIGDALTGPGFRSTGGAPGTGTPADTRTTEDNESDGTAGPNGIDWRRAFPQTAAVGGFDLVIGNPPYLREKGAQAIFSRLAQSELGRRWRQPRMDLWHYFLHRGLDLLRSGGVLCYILNSYWMSARSAEPMIDRLRRETAVREIVLLGDAPIFDGVSGRHMILQVQKRPVEEQHLHSDDPCRVTDLSDIPDAETLLSAVSAISPAAVEPDGKRVRRVPQESLYVRGRFFPNGGPRRSAAHGQTLLGEQFEVRQGIAENPPFVTRAIREELGGGLEVGDGLFVLTSEEAASLGLSQTERTLLRPYYVARAVARFGIPPQPAHWLLYLTPRTAPDLSVLPRVFQHLSRIRPVLERRREVQRGTIAWWHLHWPREERLFLEPRILAGQMGRRPRFVYVERPAFVGFSINVIRAPQTTSLSLPAATAVLNSEWAADWFTRHAKHRGVALDISGTLLREFPFPSFDAQVERRLSSLCLLRQQIASAPANVPPAETDPQCLEIEREIQSLL